jgi:hypothetical protein
MFALLFWSSVAYFVAGPWSLVVAIPLILTASIGLKTRP